MKRRLQGPFRQERQLPAVVLFLGRQHRNPCLKPLGVHRYLRPHRLRLKEGEPDKIDMILAVVAFLVTVGCVVVLKVL